MGQKRDLKPNGEKGGRLEVYQTRFEMLLAYPKCLRDQLLFEFPCLMGLRAGEVTSIRVKHINLETGDMEILDSKKHRFFTRPIPPVVAMHVSQYLAEQPKNPDDFLISVLPHAHRKKRKPGSKCPGEGITDETVSHIWAKYCLMLNIPVMPARYGRAYYAAVLVFKKKLSTFYIQVAMRHDFIQTTICYLQRIVNYEDFKAAVMAGEESPFTPHCVRAVSNGCPNQCFEPRPCYCRDFTPLAAVVEKVEVSTVEVTRTEVTKTIVERKVGRGIYYTIQKPTPTENMATSR